MHTGDRDKIHNYFNKTLKLNMELINQYYRYDEVNDKYDKMKNIDNINDDESIGIVYEGNNNHIIKLLMTTQNYRMKYYK